MDNVFRGAAAAELYVRVAVEEFLMSEVERFEVQRERQRVAHRLREPAARRGIALMDVLAVQAGLP
ncbi:hypothetical protein [Streptomyces lunaelactis]|uniref:hypothetical protein n=1 Tax=Streptomyces lunaelactis TaxID=1535768 RepID=UPI002815B45A|nr:hypothetical protein [Streptomyces lunaelactis]